MPEGNGKDNTQQRIEQLEQMDKLLLRAQVLQADMIERNAKAIERHEKFLVEMEQWKRDGLEREKRLDERIEKLVSSIGELIARTGQRSA